MTTFSPEATRAIDLVNNTDTNVFITGKAGTGKSTLLEHIRLHSKKNLIVLAPTGVSAVHVHGDTIHSFFTLKPGYEKDEAMSMRIDEKKASKYKRIKTIAIDEISMVRADLLDAVDIVLRRARKDDRAFGGVQMIFFGDLYQLPPVVTPSDHQKFYAEYPSPYFFDAQVFNAQTDLFGNGLTFETVELSTIYRQQDTTFIDVLNAVRDNTVTAAHLATLNARLDEAFTPKKKEKYMYLMTTNASAQVINDARLGDIWSVEKTFTADITGDVPRNLYPNDTSITLKVGAQVMFVNNEPERQWVNGTIGTVKKIEEVYSEEKKKKEPVITIETSDGMRKVRPHTWEISKYMFQGKEFVREVMGSFTQLPVKLAWAITIHKSQGKTFEKVILDLGRGAFAHGQTYVALSRCTSLEGLVLKKPITKRSIIMDERVREFTNGKK